MEKVICKDTCEFCGLTSGRAAVVKKSYFYNGETHFRGFWEDTGEKIDLPTVFFDGWTERC